MVPARLADFADTIRTLDPDANAALYDIETQGHHLTDHLHLSRASQRFPTDISRSDLGILSREAHTDWEGLLALLLAAMIWGYSTVGYGP